MTAPVLAVTAAVLVALIAGLVYVTTRPGPERHDTTGHTTASTQPAPHPTVVLPTKRPDTLSGAVLRNGRPLSDASVSVALQPTGAVQDKLKKGQTLPTRNLPAKRTGVHGAFVITLSHADIVDPLVVDTGGYINFEIDVTVGDRMATYGSTFVIRHGTTAPIQMIFDFGTQTVSLNGHRSKLTIF